MSNPVRWGIMGTGGIAAAFAADLKLTDSGTVVAVGSRSQAGAAAFDAAVRCYANVNAWTIATPADVGAALAGLPAGWCGRARRRPQ